MKPLLWIHEDALSPGAATFTTHPGAPARFVFDPEYLKQEGYSLKRILFLYECLLELPVEILRGETVTELLAAARESGCGAVVTTESANPWIKQVISRLQDSIPVTVLPAEPFVELKHRPDLRRFSRFWKSAEAVLAQEAHNEESLSDAPTHLPSRRGGRAILHREE